MYNAIVFRLKELDGTSPTLPELRSKTAEFLRENRTEFLPYLSHPDTGNMLSESQYAEYCDQVANTTAWGGEIEVKKYFNECIGILLQKECGTPLRFGCDEI